MHTRNPFRAIARTALRALAIALIACKSDSVTSPSSSTGELLLVTSVADASGSNGAGYVQTASLDQGQITNANAFEQVFFPYVFISGNDVIVTEHFYGDEAVHYVRGSDGKLTVNGKISLPPGGFGTNVVFASPTKAYVAMVYTGKILVINPQTMTKTSEIDLTTLGIARNPSNPADRNPEPAVMHLRDGKLFVGLQQLTTGFASADGADVLVINTTTDQMEKVIRDTRASSPGRYGYNQTMFEDEQGDLYVYCIASFGYVPGQKSGILRIKKGQTDFDPAYFVNLTDATFGVPGGKIGILNGLGYGGNGFLYAIAQVPALQSNPPQYATDRAFQAMRIRIANGQVELLPLPLGNGNAAGVTFLKGKVLFGLSTATGVGVYTYDPATGQASNGPVLRTVGDPTVVLAF